MIDSQMTGTVRDVAIMTSEFIGGNKTSAIHLCDSCRDECLIGDILNNTLIDFSSALQDAEH
ncbi:MAG: hypothetical protein WCF90_00730 [Methanomicrobiales archaeon]